MCSIDELQAKRKTLWHNLKLSHDSMVRANELAGKLTNRYNRDRLAWEECDKQLAMLDGRFEKLQAVEAANQSSSKKRVPKVDLTEEQILAIAAKLGITLEEIVD